MQLQISAPVETDGEGAFLVIVRTLQGTVWPGVRLDAVRDDAGKERPADLTVQRIWLFQREVDLLSPGSTGKLRITGDSGGVLTENSVLLGRTAEEHSRS
ncbi:hypothetical protein E1287_01660 [Actinomadura sp. KC06]|uniref:hypothetical protein n=1 Tax=Actinomadura sp. KC06 TaxID=2530369 RepID=UPI001043A294|nr:hypothetical protein [Actinomadura sp. KC06]TDD40244.1 hypothetical protein E1287_01660 [Actinomadura sp. KC06]